MRCDYCGLDIIGTPIAVEISEESLHADSDLPAGLLRFCSEGCLAAFREEAGIVSGDPEDQDLMDEEYDFYKFWTLRT